MSTFIGGLTPRKYFHLYGKLPPDATEHILDQIDLFYDLAAIATLISHDLTSQTFSNPTAFDLIQVRALSRVLSETNK